MRVTPCSRTEDWRNRHISARRLAGASVELRELEHFDHRVTRLTASKIRYYKAAAIKGPLLQRFTAKEVDSDGNVCPHFYDRVEWYGRQGNSINQPLLTASPDGWAKGVKSAFCCLSMLLQSSNSSVKLFLFRYSLLHQQIGRAHR